MGVLPAPLDAALARQGLSAQCAASAFQALGLLVRGGPVAAEGAGEGLRVLILVEPAGDIAASSRLADAVRMHAPEATMWAYQHEQGGVSLRAVGPGEWNVPVVREGFAGVAPKVRARPAASGPGVAGDRRSESGGDIGGESGGEHALGAMDRNARARSHGGLRLTGSGELPPVHDAGLDGDVGFPDVAGPRDLLSDEELAMLLGDTGGVTGRPPRDDRG